MEHGRGPERIESDSGSSSTPRPLRAVLLTDNLRSRSSRPLTASTAGTKAVSGAGADKRKKNAEGELPAKAGRFPHDDQRRGRAGVDCGRRAAGQDPAARGASRRIRFRAVRQWTGSSSMPMETALQFTRGCEGRSGTAERIEHDMPRPGKRSDQLFQGLHGFFSRVQAVAGIREVEHIRHGRGWRLGPALRQQISRLMVREKETRF